MVSVFLAARDGAAFLNEAIDSILRQDFPDFEFLVVDDGSTDSTPRCWPPWRPEMHG